MARKGIRAVSVYVTDDELETLQAAAEADSRSLSNFLLAEGLRRAKDVLGEKAQRKPKAKRAS